MNQNFGTSGAYPHRDYGSTSMSGSNQSMLRSNDFAGFSPTEFISLKENIASNIVYIKSAWHQLDKATKLIGTPKDNQEQRDRIHTVQMSTNQKVTDTSKDIKRLGALVRGGDKQQKLEVDRLTHEFKTIVEKYSKSQQTVATKMKQIFLVNAATAAQQDYNQFDEQNESIDQTSLQHQRQTERELQLEQERLIDREQRIRQIESDVLDVNKIFKDLSSMVYDQGQVVGMLNHPLSIYIQNLIISFLLRYNRKYY